jgi:hypothetical protein
MVGPAYALRSHSNRARRFRMIIRLRQIAALLALMLLAGSLGGCASINEKMGSAVGDYLPQWAGGLPPDVPPRRGTPEYDAYMKERERKRLEPAPANANAAAPSSSSTTSAGPPNASSAPALNPVH